MSAVPNRNAATALLPWMLTWMVVGFGFDIPYLASGVGSGEVVANSLSFVLLRLDAILQGIPPIVLAIGLLAVFAPFGRGAIVERRLGLAARRRPIIAEIEDFLREHGATVEVRCNLARQDRLARSYPVGWRRARLAVFGPFAAFWRRDRSAAQAVLLHEIAHVRTGDQLFLGLDSPFVALINLWFPLLVILGVIPLAGLALTQYPTAGLLAGQLLLVLTLLPEALLLPVGALWLAELSTDRYVADAGLRDGLLRSLNTNDRRGGRYLDALARLSHPPRALRIWALRGGSGQQLIESATRGSAGCPGNPDPTPESSSGAGQVADAPADLGVPVGV